MSLLDKVKQLEKTAKLKGTASHEKRPRQYAAEIIALKTRDERKAALALVPVEYQGWVSFYVRDFFARRNGTALPKYGRPTETPGTNLEPDAAMRMRELPVQERDDDGLPDGGQRDMAL